MRATASLLLRWLANRKLQEAVTCAYFNGNGSRPSLRLCHSEIWLFRHQFHPAQRLELPCPTGLIPVVGCDVGVDATAEVDLFGAEEDLRRIDGAIPFRREHPAIDVPKPLGTLVGKLGATSRLKVYKAVFEPKVTQ